MRVQTALVILLAGMLMPATVMGKEGRKMGDLKITSPAFTNKGAIPARFTCDGQDLNPALAFDAVPVGTRSLALIVDDPDAPVGTWVHWVVWNIPPQTREIKENSIPNGAVQGLNDWKRNRYGGPCPPSGTHRYYFKLYALDTTLDLPSSTTKTALERAMEGHILAKGEIMGTYRRH
ncbi:YbhB/YbcL family Raf kinase inhibitor-like protein [Geotalea uraniireducens]|uniref:Phospholipid-binding protein, PBP family n=1 Tax=Geotalea uraniireducens (strain Rf4) TaxID=351605 RepID=A5GEI8_GEOUR|nr:YbhB/YbcL family Raf kinase inhibitor-like protein [Geotalea uraniireducens]ABQ25843.1 phospholipid-binding protein, PBP family [Geotalea uraniireducens Rf4]